MMFNRILKTFTVIVGVVSIFGWLMVGDTPIGVMLLMGSIVISLVAHLWIMPQDVVSAPAPIQVPEVSEIPPPPVIEKTPEELEAEQLKARLAELQKTNSKPTTEQLDQPPIPPPNYKQVNPNQILCKFCGLECRNKWALDMHFLSKHKDKVNLTVSD